MNQTDISVAEAFEPDERRKREENGYFPRHEFSFRRIQRGKDLRRRERGVAK